MPGQAGSGAGPSRVSDASPRRRRSHALPHLHITASRNPRRHDRPSSTPRALSGKTCPLPPSTTSRLRLLSATRPRHPRPFSTSSTSARTQVSTPTTAASATTMLPLLTPPRSTSYGPNGRQSSARAAACASGETCSAASSPIPVPAVTTLTRKLPAFAPSRGTSCSRRPAKSRPI